MNSIRTTCTNSAPLSKTKASTRPFTSVIVIKNDVEKLFFVSVTSRGAEPTFKTWRSMMADDLPHKRKNLFVKQLLKFGADSFNVETLATTHSKNPHVIDIYFKHYIKQFIDAGYTCCNTNKRQMGHDNVRFKASSVASNQLLQVIDLLLNAPEMNTQEIAVVAGVTRTFVYRTNRRPATALTMKGSGPRDAQGIIEKMGLQYPLRKYDRLNSVGSRHDLQSPLSKTKAKQKAKTK